ncbi:major capsid family protein [Novosphingobium sp. BL-8A]|uniref:major capsid family protein n=1 Tax=Novosphingobium sp. BL-8A TaxID=3127639 RepID=UPI00375837B3
MTKPIFFDSVATAVAHLAAEDASVAAFVDAIRGVDLNDAQQVNAFLMPQLLRVEQGVYMIKYPLADYAEFMPIDTQGTIWTAGSLYYSGDIAGKPEWFDVAADDMPYADSSRTQFLQENWIAAIGYKWNRADLERGQQLGINILADKADAASKSAERFIHKTAMRGDGLKFTTGFINNPLATTTTAAGAITAASDPDADVAVINDAITSVEVNTGETFQADTLAVPTSTFNLLASKRMTDTGMSVLNYMRQNSVIGALNIKKSRHLETAGSGGTKRLIAYANTNDVHRFHLPGGGHQLFNSQPYQKGPFSWEVPGLMSIGGYENRIPKAITFVDGV